MQKISNPKSYQAHCLKLKKRGTLGFVPTMGCLHLGHLTLIRESVKHCDFTAVSIFVNPLQFGPKEDFLCYPRPMKEDLLLCKQAGVDLVFLPTPKALYGPHFSITMDETQVSRNYCGASRPGHFSGVLTVMAKLLNCTQADFLWMGKKDFQQCLVVRRLIENLNFPTVFKAYETVREKDGLAMSSRNRNLSLEARKNAPLIYAALKSTRALSRKGEKLETLSQHLHQSLNAIPGFKIDYAKLANRDTLQEATPETKKRVALVAGFFGSTRLIDNLEF
jgi:pantoate--beta-alanine ligase